MLCLVIQNYCQNLSKYNVLKVCLCIFTMDYDKLNLSENYIFAFPVSYFTKILCLMSPAELFTSNVKKN